MKKPKTSLRQQVQPVIGFVLKYKKFLFVLTVMVMILFLVFRINQLSLAEPSQSAIDEKLKTVARPKFDESVLNRIQQLQDQNVQVQSLFDQARNNPFSE